MFGIEDYGSDAESGDENSVTTSKTTPTASTTSKPLTAPASSLASKLPPPTSKSKSTFALPPPKSSTTTTFSLPPPSTTHTTNSAPTKQKRTKKIAINLPDLPPEEDDDERPPTKKPRITSTPDTGAGKSALLSMLPAPKQLVPVIEKKEERVLGGGGGPGLVFRSSRSEPRSGAVTDSVGGYGLDVDGGDGVDAEAEVEPALGASGPSTSFLSPSLKKGKANISLDNEGPSRPPRQPHKSAAPAVDFFSLGSSTTSTRSIPAPSPSSSTSTTTTTARSAPSTSSAPNIPTFRPPSPTLDDAYPGYYQLPSGAYAPYDAEYYASYARKWKSEYDKHIRALEKSQYEVEGAQDVNMAAEMEKSRREVKEREDRKALTAGNLGTKEDGEPEMPRMNVKGAKLGSVAKSRHQLTTLLTEAYLNREVLEDKIAQARRNRKEAGNKYGF